MLLLILTAFLFAHFGASPIWWGLLVGLVIIELRAFYKQYKEAQELGEILAAVTKEKPRGPDQPS